MESCHPHPSCMRTRCRRARNGPQGSIPEAHGLQPPASGAVGGHRGCAVTSHGAGGTASALAVSSQQRAPGSGHAVWGPGLPTSAHSLPLRPRCAIQEPELSLGRPHGPACLSPRAAPSTAQSCRLPHAPTAPCQSQKAALNLEVPRQAVTSRPLGPPARTPPHLGEQREGHEGQVSSGSPLWSSPPGPSHRAPTPRVGQAAENRGGGAEALRDALGKPGAWNSPGLLSPPRGRGCSPAASRRPGGRGCCCASWAPRASTVVPTLPAPHACPQRRPGSSRGASAPDRRTSVANGF